MAFLRCFRKIAKSQTARLACALGLCIILANEMTTEMQGQEIEEYQLKAAFLFNFTKFISWPHADASSKLTVCVVSAKEVAGALEAVIRGKSVDARQVVVQQLNSPAALETCQLLFIGASGKKMEETLVAAKNLAIVTVGEDEKFLRRGGMINFVLEEGKLRFEINTDAASRAGINISSKLLSLAKIVRDKS
jgi:hypothetical protein